MKFLFFIMSVFLLSCSPAAIPKKDVAAFENSKVVLKYRNMTDINESYFVLKQNNFCEFYSLLFDSVKNTAYPGKYTQEGNELRLKFYDKKAGKSLGRKALLDTVKKEIIFYDKYIGSKQFILF